MRSINSSRPVSKILLLRIAILAGIFIVSAIWDPHGLHLCLFHGLTGLECPGCGMTRAFCAISHGQPAEAIQLNMFSVALYMVFMGILFRDLLYLFTGRRLGIPGSLKLEGAAGYAVLFIVVSYGVMRNTPLSL
ncbi:DUF2752 domain-containing protein [Chloroflexota bacterium]